MKRHHKVLGDGGRTAQYFFGGEWPVQLDSSVRSPLECRVISNEFERRAYHGIDVNLTWEPMDRRYGGHSPPMPDVKFLDGAEVKNMFHGRWPIDPTTESFKDEKLVAVCIEYARRRAQNIPADMPWDEIPAFRKKRLSSSRNHKVDVLPIVLHKRAKVTDEVADESKLEPELELEPPIQQPTEKTEQQRRSDTVRKSRVRGTPGTAAYKKNCARAAAHKYRMKKTALAVALQLHEQQIRKRSMAVAAKDRRLLADSVPNLVMNLPDFADDLANLVKIYVEKMLDNDDNDVETV